MFNFRLSLQYVGFILWVFSFSMLFPIAISLYFDTDPFPFIYSFSITAVIGWSVWKYFKSRQESDHIHRKDSLLIVVLVWLGVSFFGSLPYIFSDAFGSISLGAGVDAWFESTSGFATVGASVMNHIESMPSDILFWRALTQWIGGGGIIVLAVAILPFLGVGGLELFQAETPGPTTDKLQPRVAQTARALWKIYLVLTALCFICLVVAGMPIFDALCHTFSTVSTGGFSTRNASVGAYGVPAYEWIIIVFMFLAACNFVLHYYFMSDPWVYFRDQQFKAFCWIILVATGLIILDVGIHQGSTHWHDDIRHALFSVVSVVATCGFSATDYVQWPSLSQMVLVFLLIVGGCAGSTSGGIKVIRVVVIAKHALNELLRFIHPQSVSVIKVGGQVVNSDTLNGVFGFLTIYFFVALISIGMLSFLGADFSTAISGVLACLAGAGPGIGLVGPHDTYAWLHPMSKCVLSLDMLLGRLEMITFVTLCVPEYWKK